MKIACALSLCVFGMANFMTPAAYAAETAGKNLVDEFVAVCINHGPDPDLIEASLQARGAKRKQSSPLRAALGMSYLRAYQEKSAGNTYFLVFDDNGTCSVSQEGANLPQAHADLKGVVDNSDRDFRISKTQDTRRAGNGRLVAGYLFETKNATPAFKIVLTAYKPDARKETLFITRYYVHF